jgi:hypothetical protein
MSVDDQLRAAFAETDESWAPRADAVLREVRRRRARGVLVRRGLAAAALAAAVVTGVVLVTADGLGGDAAPDPLQPPTPTPTPTQADPTPSQTVLEGRWRSPLVDAGDLRAALEESGNGQYADAVLPNLRPVPFRLVWLVTRGTAELRMVSKDGSAALDMVTVTVDGDRVTMRPRFADGASVHLFTVDGDELRLTFVSTTERRSGDVPGEVWQRLLYDAFPFVRR